MKRRIICGPKKMTSMKKRDEMKAGIIVRWMRVYYDEWALGDASFMGTL